MFVAEVTKEFGISISSLNRLFLAHIHQTSAKNRSHFTLFLILLQSEQCKVRSILAYCRSVVSVCIENYEIVGSYSNSVPSVCTNISLHYMCTYIHTHICT
jgi:hypothetical protein